MIFYGSKSQRVFMVVVICLGFFAVGLVSAGPRIESSPKQNAPLNEEAPLKDGCGYDQLVAEGRNAWSALTGALTEAQLTAGGPKLLKWLKELGRCADDVPAPHPHGRPQTPDLPEVNPSRMIPDEFRPPVLRPGQLDEVQCWGFSMLVYSACYSCTFFMPIDYPGRGTCREIAGRALKSCKDGRPRWYGPGYNLPFDNCVRTLKPRIYQDLEELFP
jgi:hypothetical protein